MTTNQDPWLSPSIHEEDTTNIFDDNFVNSPPSCATTSTGCAATTSTQTADASDATDDELSKGVKKIATRVDAMFATNYMSNQDYAKKLESKLKVLQKQNQPNGKEMLENLKERKDFYLNELLSGLTIIHTDDDVTMTSPSFLDRLYSTNELYRHLNPQQALDSSEKEPFAKHDYLAKNVENAEDGVGVTMTNDLTSSGNGDTMETTETSTK